MKTTRYKITSLIISFLFITSFACSPRIAPTIDSVTNISILQSDVTYLASDELEGREVGTPGEDKAAMHIVNRMQDIGLKAGMPDGYLQHFSRRIKSNPHADEEQPDDKVINGKNVLGMIDNGGDHYVVIGAHYDHLGYGEEGSLHAGERTIHNGADDNASGVAVLLNLAYKLFNNNVIEKNNFIFIAFSGEEKGLWGSNFYVKNATVSLSDINFMFNMDMIGRLNQEKSLAVHGAGTTPLFKELLEHKNTTGFNLVISDSGVGPSDHTSFYLEDIPVLHFFTGQHEDYHKPSDTAEKLNYQGMVEIADYLYSLIMDLDNKDKLPFTKTKDESRDAPRFQVTLGVIPDYLYQGKGMRIDGVRDGKPAELAGMMKGDIVVKMEDLEIVDMMSYMQGLSSFQQGQTITVTIIRNEKEMRKAVTF